MEHYFLSGFSLCQEGGFSQLSSGAPSKGAAALCVGCHLKKIHLVPAILAEPASQVLPVGYLSFVYPCRAHGLVRLGSLLPSH